MSNGRRKCPIEIRFDQSITIVYANFDQMILELLTAQGTEAVNN